MTASAKPSTVHLERFYTELSGALGQVMPDLLHLHYGVAEREPRGLKETLHVLKQGPANMLAQVLDAAELDSLPPHARSVDLGCGLGGTCIEIAKRHELSMVAMDRNGVQLTRARGRFQSFGLSARVQLARGLVTELPFADRSFDLASLVEVVFHVEHKQALFAELERVMRPGGRVVLIDQEMRGGGLDALGFFHFAGHGRLAELAHEHGFTVRREIDLSERVAVWMGAYARFGSRPFQLGLLATALMRGGPALAARLRRGLALYDRLILDEIGQRPDLPHLRGASTGIQALRLHTQHLLENGDARYLALILERQP